MMSKPAAGKAHPDEEAYMRFLERKDTSADYVRRSAEWLRNEYPGSEAALLPRMRKLYKQKLREVS
jgi:hypothetical protein